MAKVADIPMPRLVRRGKVPTITIRQRADRAAAVGKAEMVDLGALRVRMPPVMALLRAAVVRVRQGQAMSRATVRQVGSS